eukprot:CAMPEP_0206233802 /NCGR_PEP_ID=MMETSP0047_2-20121206/12218_1 /ASSEMBLY_ACC=CAM_ASM_000192 /TAXON_ID=195065 /ORGANISM="Chroomonas mesostigmatica_cf, Strain CCMP1168" /LENGTH=227 /DNA_ID=CAMNT_0053657779 /DNA_START=136 /DNA_END=819 /DNA_ORIENTATION=+
MMRLSAVLLLALVCAPAAHAWIGGSPWMVPAMMDDMMDPFDSLLGPRSARSILREADRTFRRLDHMMSNLAQVADPQDPARESPSLRGGEKNETSSAVATKPHHKNLELRLRPTFEWKETDNGFLLTGAMPGLSKDELSVEVVESPHRGGGAYVVVTGETKKETKTPEGQAPVEIRATYKKFEQRVKLPEGVDKESLTAKYEDGMLQIHIAYPKEAERSERKKITIN